MPKRKKLDRPPAAIYAKVIRDGKLKWLEAQYDIEDVEVDDREEVLIGIYVLESVKKARKIMELDDE